MNQRNLSKVIFGSLLLCSASTAVADSSLTLAFTPDPLRVTGIAKSSAPLQLGVVTFDQSTPPTAVQLKALRESGLQVQPMTQLPIALIRGTPEQLASAARSESGYRFYPNQGLRYFAADTNALIGIDAIHALGFTGKGVQVAVVDTGLDATHEDLKDHVTHNVKIFGPQPAGLPIELPTGPLTGPILVPVDQGPYSNTDVGYAGHGTLVAGVLAADGHTSPFQVGVAPDAELIGVSLGDFPTIASAVTALDYVLGSGWGVDVVSISWGTGIGTPFDPADPITIATRALTDHGIAVVVAAGNSGENESEMSMNLVAIPPWNIMVAGSTSDSRRWSSSSNGLTMDNSLPLALVDGHRRFVGDRLGMFHPTVAAPATDITTTCTPSGVIFSLNCTPSGTVSDGAGTSFSAPLVAGLVALLRQARPGLTVEQVRQVLEATATPTAERAPFWQVGYGIVDGRAALDLVRAKKFERKLADAHNAAEARALASRHWRVDASEQWTWDQAVVTVAGVPESRDFSIEVPAGTDALKVVLMYAFSAAAYTDANLNAYSFTVRDAAGQDMGAPTASPSFGVSTLLVDLRDRPYAPGDWTVHVEGTLGNVAYPLGFGEYDFKATVIAALLEAQVAVIPPKPEFAADGALALQFIPDPTRATGAMSPEGCAIEPGQAIGSLGPALPEGPCHSASHGWLEYNPELPAEFSSAPLADAITIGDTASIVVHIADALREPASAAVVGRFEYRLDAIVADGTVTSLSAGETLHGLVDGRNEGAFDVTPVQVPKGARLRLQLLYPGVTSSAARLLFGGEAYGDSGITLTVGHFGSKKNSSEPAADNPEAKEGEAAGVATGALPSAAVLVLVGLLAVRRRWGRG